jgi:hypothetical protein
MNLDLPHDCLMTNPLDPVFIERICRYVELHEPLTTALASGSKGLTRIASESRYP